MPSVTPDPSQSSLVVPAPGEGPHHWAGAPSAARSDDGTYVLAYRVRSGFDGVDATVVARSDNGVDFDTVLTLTKHDFGARWVERPTILQTPEGRWRLYVCCGPMTGSQWWVEGLEAESLECLATAPRRVVFPGTELLAVKDPVIKFEDGVWKAWLCCHLIDDLAADDRMRTDFATSVDGWTWKQHGTVLEGTPGSWDQRGVRITGVLPDGRVFYDGRASRAENWFERSGLARPTGDTYAAIPGAPVADLRYVEALGLPDNSIRLYYEVRLPDESHELRTQLIAAQ